MKQTNDVIILNRPRVQKRGLALNLNGRITLRSSPCKLLDLHPGDKICFCFHTESKQMYVIKTTPDIEAKEVACIKLSGRKGQLHASDVSTVSFLLSYIPNIPTGTKQIELVTANETINLNVNSVSCPALAIVNRADSEHCR